MHCNYDNKFTSDIIEKDRKILIQILARYSFKTIMVEPVRSAYKVYTDRGIFCLKKVGNGYNRAKKAYIVSNYMKKSGFNKLADYILTSNNCLFIRHKKATYYLTKWINGSEVSFNNKEDIIECTKLIAEFHESSKGFVLTDNIVIKKLYDKWGEQFGCKWNDIRQIVAQIKKNRNSTIFDKLYSECYKVFKPYYKLTKMILSHKIYVKYSAKMKKESYICHDSFYYQNVLKADSKLFIVDMESCTMDMPISDLGHFIRRIMARTKHMWDFALCKDIIDAYSTVRPLSRDELIILLGIIVFPHKYWRLGKKKYIKQKKWSDKKYLKKVKKLLIQQEYIDRFIKEYKSMYNISMYIESNKELTLY